MQVEAKIKAYIERVLKLYFEEQNMEALLEVMDERVSWIGNEGEKICSSRMEVYQLLKDTRRNFVAKREIQDKEYTIVKVAESEYIIYGWLKITVGKTKDWVTKERFTIVCQATEETVQMQHVHMSMTEDIPLVSERHQVILEQTRDIIFEWDIKKDILEFSQNCCKYLGCKPIVYDASQRLMRASRIYKEDYDKIGRLLRLIRDGKPYNEVEIRCVDGCGCKVWSRIKATTQYDTEGRPVKAVGMISDIDGDKKKQAYLLDLARKDSLTGLYNKKTIQSLTEEVLQREDLKGYNVMMAIDVDDFKGINDTFGHLSGDATLLKVAEILKDTFRSTDLIGRVGGDEFMVLLTEIPDKKIADKKVTEVLDALNRSEEGGKGACFACSIGVAMEPCGTGAFRNLFGKADKALYQVKKSEKGNALFYNQ